MENNNKEKFFEELAEKMANSEFTNSGEEVKVELVKAGTVESRPKIVIQANDEENEEEAFDGEPEGQLTVDVYQTPNEIVVESAVAGVEPDSLDINITSDSIAIRGQRHKEKKVRDDDYLYQECYWGRFSRSIILPQEIDPERARATFKNGILTVHLPKLNKQRTKKLKIKLE